MFNRLRKLCGRYMRALLPRKLYKLIANGAIIVPAYIIRKTKRSAFLERSVLFRKTKCSFSRAPKHPYPTLFTHVFIPQIIAKNFGHLAKNDYICIV